MNPSCSRFLILTIGYLLSAITGSAHPGHDLLDHGAAHVVASPFHLLVLAAGGIVLALIAKFVRTSRARAVLRIGAMACIVVAAPLAILR
jgi:hypothetical protein